MRYTNSWQKGRTRSIWPTAFQRPPRWLTAKTTWAADEQTTSTVDARIGQGLLAGLVAAIAAASTAPFIAPPTVAAEPVTATALVLKVVDGGTIDIRDDVRGRLRIRVLGIDTPETKKPGYTVGCWGLEATEFAKSTMLGQRVAFVPDPTQDQTDRYGRTLAYLVRADG